jgi:hypothetical protein
MKRTILLLGILLPLFSIAGKKIGRDEIRGKMKENLSSFKDCYEEGLKTNPKIGGRVVLEWDVDETGSVKRADVKDTAVENCMVDKLKAIKFPPAPTGQIVSVFYPFVFSANK